jgi:integrase
MRGTIRKRGNTWSIVYDERPDPVTGKRRRRERGGYTTLDEAETALAEAIAAVRSGGYVDPSKITVARFLTDWIARKAQDDLEPTTASSYRSKIDHHLVPRLGDLRVQELEVSAIEDMLRDVHRSGGRGGRPLSLRTVTYVRFVLASALDDAERLGIIRSNPARLARIPKRQHDDWTPRSAPRQPWTVAELRRWLTVASEDRLAALWIVLIRTGLRRGEALGLRWTDVDLENGTLRVERVRVAVKTDHGREVFDKARPKTPSSRRTVTLDVETVARLRRWKARQNEERLIASGAWLDDGRVFAREDGSGLDPDTVSARFRDLCTEAGVRPVRLHDARHGHATLMHMRGVASDATRRRMRNRALVLI